MSLAGEAVKVTDAQSQAVAMSPRAEGHFRRGLVLMLENYLGGPLHEGELDPQELVEDEALILPDGTVAEAKVTRSLDPTFSPIETIREFGVRLTTERARQQFSSQRMLQAASEAGDLLASLPHRIDLISTSLANNEFGVRVDAPQVDDLLNEIRRAQGQQRLDGTAQASDDFDRASAKMETEMAYQDALRELALPEADDILARFEQQHGMTLTREVGREWAAARARADDDVLVRLGL